MPPSQPSRPAKLDDWTAADWRSYWTAVSLHLQSRVDKKAFIQSMLHKRRGESLLADKEPPADMDPLEEEIRRASRSDRGEVDPSPPAAPKPTPPPVSKGLNLRRL